MNKLAEIIATKHREVEKLLPKQEFLRLAALERNDVRSLHAALMLGEEHLGVIAEVKKASPSAGVIQPDFDPVAQAIAYDKAGASAISVLTDEQYFQGHLSYLTQIRRQVACPVLRKDFIIHDVQIYEAAVAGADAILLIVAALTQDELVHLLETAAKVQMDVLVEVHDREELDRALETDAKIIGINNRNLKTFKVDLATTEELSEEIPEDVILVSESGIRTVADARTVWSWGANAILVGEALMRSADPAAMVAEFIAAPESSAAAEG
jgi:indole-3-glycerol phosphate synthase